MIQYILGKYITSIGKIDSKFKENRQPKLGIVNV